MKLTLFDLDHTLLDGDSDVLWCNYLIGKKILNAASFSTRNIDMEARYQAGTVGAQEFADFYVNTLTGKSPAQWDPLRKEFLMMEIIPRITPAAIELVKTHLKAKDLVVMTTATNRFITELTAAFFKIENLIATEPEMERGMFTGRTVGQLNMREGKIIRLNAWLNQCGLKLHECDSVAYSDSINDLPLLQAVNHPVAVDPDAKLRAIAVKLHWPVLSLR